MRLSPAALLWGISLAQRTLITPPIKVPRFTQKFSTRLPTALTEDTMNGVHQPDTGKGGLILATASYDRTIKLWEPLEGSCYRTIGSESVFPSTRPNSDCG